jgi:hypothetical protein
LAEGDEREDLVAARVWDRVMGADDEDVDDVDDVDDRDVLAAVVVVVALASIAAGRFSRNTGVGLLAYWYQGQRPDQQSEMNYGQPRMKRRVRMRMRIGARRRTKREMMLMMMVILMAELVLLLYCC